MTQRPLIWSLTAADSSGGAGSAADLRMGQAMQVDCAVLTLAVTAQNSRGVQALTLLDEATLTAQWQSLQQDGWPAVIRLGWLPALPAFLGWLLPRLEMFPGRVVWDPVLSATQGGVLHSDWQQEDTRPWLLRLLRRADVLTPNLAEARRLSGRLTATAAACAAALQQQGAGHLLITGGDSDGGEWIEDGFFSQPRHPLGQGELPGPELLPVFRFRHRRLLRRVHGSGCHLAAALACALAQGQSLYDALTTAVAAARLAIRHASPRASGYDNAWAVAPEAGTADDWPQVVAPQAGERGQAFATAAPLGLYALVDNLAHLQCLLALGVDTLQWRVKQPGPGYADDTAEAIRMCRAAGVPLYLNDDWQLALALQADGVHLGQEDLGRADLTALQAAGIRLGISTHSEWEIARARAIQPSYIAFGPVFTPLSKVLRYRPLGIARLTQWTQRYRQQPLTCIGGITHANAAAVLASGVGSVAVVTDLRHDAGLPQRLQQLRRCWSPVTPSLEMV